MRVEELALRSEIRQMLNEAGFNRDTIKQLVKDTLEEIVRGQVKQALAESSEDAVYTYIHNFMREKVQSLVREAVRDSVYKKLNNMKCEVTITEDAIKND